MHSYFVIKLQVGNGNADTCWGKKKMYFQTLHKDGISWIELHTQRGFLTHLHTQAPPHTHTQSSQYNTAADPLS